MDEQMDLRNPGNPKNCSTFLPLSIGGLSIFLSLDLFIDVAQQLYHNIHNRIPPGYLLHENPSQQHHILCSKHLHNM